MIEFTHTEVFNFDGALRGARNSWESHHKSDSGWDEDFRTTYIIGEADKALLMKLAKAGASHAKFMRQILVCVDIDAPLYWWKEFDQYKVGTVTNSESTMHTIQRQSMDETLFSLDIPDIVEQDTVNGIMDSLEHLKQMYLTTKDKRYWKLLIQLLPSGWMQKRTTTLNYAVIANAYHDRKGHRLSEWEDFRKWADTLPYSELITGKEV